MCLVHRLTRRLVAKRCAGLIYVTPELERVLPHQRFSTLKAFISNGIDLTRVGPLSSAPHDSPRLVFVGSPGLLWHGIDKLAALGRARPLWRIDVVGPAPVEYPAMPDNVVFHGRLPAKRYRPLMALADVGIGTLALHRKQMQEACPLKVREYLACGLPVIAGYRDVDFPAPPDFFLRLPNTEENIIDGIDKIDRFVRQWMGKRVPPERLRSIDGRAKEQQRLVFFEHVLKNGDL